MDKLWYKNAVIYALDVDRFFDSDGDGVGDFAGLLDHLDYVCELGVTCIWLLPFYVSPDRDNSYDIKNYYEVDPRLGTLDDFVRFLHRAGERGVRVIIDLVMNHTSDQHPWFQASRRSPASRFRSYYTWTDAPPPTPPGQGTIFPGEEESVWTFDEVAGAYYYHKFYHFQPDLNLANEEVREEVMRVLDFWLSFGVSGFRVDAAPHMIESNGIPASAPRDPHGVLKHLRRFVQQRRPDAVLIGESDVEPEQIVSFFGDDDELNLLFNFLLNNHLFLALARREAHPIVELLKQLPAVPPSAQWANFVRNLDEVDLERLTDAEREEVYRAFAPAEEMRIFNRGIRRRIAPMLGGDRRLLELVFSFTFSLPGTPVLIYGDEIGMGEDLSQRGRAAVRAPMQWSKAKNAGFSKAPAGRLIQPVIAEGPFDYRRVNVADQQRDPGSFLCWMKRLIRTRRGCPELGLGTWHTIETGKPNVFAHRCAWKDGLVIALHNLADRRTRVDLDLHDQKGRTLLDLLNERHHADIGDGACRIDLEPYGYHWFRIEGRRHEA